MGFLEFLLDDMFSVFVRNFPAYIYGGVMFFLGVRYEKKRAARARR